MSLVTVATRQAADDQVFFLEGLQGRINRAREQGPAPFPKTIHASRLAFRISDRGPEPSIGRADLDRPGEVGGGLRPTAEPGTKVTSPPEERRLVRTGRSSDRLAIRLLSLVPVPALQEEIGPEGVEGTILGGRGDQSIEVPVGGEPLAGLLAAQRLPPLPGTQRLRGGVPLDRRRPELFQAGMPRFPFELGLERMSHLAVVELHAGEDLGPEVDPLDVAFNGSRHGPEPRQSLSPAARVRPSGLKASAPMRR